MFTMENKNIFMPISEYVTIHSSHQGEVTDLVLRRLPDAIALWRSRQSAWHGQLLMEMITVDASTGIPIVTTTNNGQPIDDADDVKAYGEIASQLLSTLHYSNRRVTQLIEDCRNGHFKTIGDVMLAVERNKSNAIYIPLIMIIVILVALLAWLNA